VINPDTVLGQIYGGIAMGLGYATTEDIAVENGNIHNENFDNYIFPTAADMPKMEVYLYECNDPSGTFGSKSIAEPATEAVTAAVASAIANSIGRYIPDLPADLEIVVVGKRLIPGKKRQ
jgi:CO/xanthine dehydrogenase Mo-binding subunit